MASCRCRRARTILMNDISISFLCTSYRDSDTINEGFNSIKRTCKENYEIIFASEIKYDKKFEHDNLTYIETTFSSSVPNYNEAFKHSSGDWICICTDDLIITTDPREYIKDTDESIFNICRTSAKNIPTTNKNKITNWAPGCVDYFSTPYVPCMRRGLIENVLEGKIWNENFKHHYVDVWLGLYLATKYDITHILPVECVTPYHKRSNTTHNEYDRRIYENLRSKLITDPLDCTYNMHTEDLDMFTKLEKWK